MMMRMRRKQEPAGAMDSVDLFRVAQKMATHRPGTALSPRRPSGFATPPRHMFGTPSLSPSPSIEHRPPGVARMRPRGMISTAMMISGGILSATACLSACGAAALVVRGKDAHDVLRSAMRTGACFAMSTPFLILAIRGCAMAARKGRAQLSLGFAVLPSVDEHAVFDLYVMGVLACGLGVCVPTTALLGHLMGIMLRGWSAMLAILAFAPLIPGVYFATGVCLDQLAPHEGLMPNTRPRMPMWAGSLTGHVAILWACFYSPDVYAVLGFALGFVHLGRLLELAFSIPGSCEDGVTAADMDVE